MGREKLFLIDAYALIYRFYFAFISQPMRNREGLNTSAVFGFVKFLRDILKREQPHHIGVAFDPPGGSFRRELFAEYKANRSETPEDITASVPHIKAVLEAMRIPILQVPNYEADDVIGTLAKKAAKEGYDVYMVTPDKDFGQLVDDHIYIYKQRRAGDEIEILDSKAVCDNYGISTPEHVIDILALWGDASDNIPGVPGIGEKTASKLVGEFGTVENLLKNIDSLKGKQKENILGSVQQLELSKKLATIHTDAPIDFQPEKLVVEEPDCDALREEFMTLGFSSFLRELAEGRFLPAYCTGNAAEVAARAEVRKNGTHPASPTTNPTASPAANPAAGNAPGQALDLFGMPITGTATPRPTPEPAAGSAPGDEMFKTAADTAHTYAVIANSSQLADLAAALRKKGRFCFDTETTGVDAISDRIVGMSFSIEPHKAWYVPFNQVNTTQYANILRPLFEDASIGKIAQNIKFDLLVLRSIGITVKGEKSDTMILHYLLDPESRHNMNYLSRRYLEYDPIEIETLIGKGSKQLTMDRVALDQVAEYAAEDADVTFQLNEILEPAVKEAGLIKLYKQIEEPLIDVLANMELTGVKIDTQALAAYGKKLTAELVELEDKVRELTAEPGLNINSAKQLGVVLFEKLKIDPKPKQTKTKQYSTDEEYLQQLMDRHPVVAVILEYRGVKKLLSTYVEALPQLVNPKTGRIHTSFNQAVTATGRLSSTNPNLQNIPIRDERGREIRKAFIASDKDHKVLSADYSQVELRLMAHLSGDENLIGAFLKGEDIHAATAARIFNIDIEKVTAEQRRQAKTANFGIIYGISAFGLSQRLNIPRTEAKALIDGYFASYPGVEKYIQESIAKARETGYVSTIFGRKRFLPDIDSRNAVARGMAERNAINAPIQGSAADIIKIAMAQVDAELRSKGLFSKLMLQVHDELLVDLLASEQKQVMEIITRCMEGAAELKVPLTVECGVGDNWLEAH